ncbi:MAG TPA: efflux RND transporter periplasmic adaptor subunit [Chthoniobacterales bacterium]|jgi:RND family efflux transporter MFP subunit
MKKFLLLISLLLVLGYGWTRWKGKGPDDKASAVMTAEATRETIIETVEVAGEVKPEVLVEVKPEISARILKIHVKESDHVTRGQLLVDLDNSELLTQRSAALTEIAIAELQLEKAGRDLERQQRLLKSNIITDQEFRDARTVRDVAEQGLKKTRQQLSTLESRIEKSKIMAPMDGTVLSMPIVENQVVVGAASVSAGTLLMSVANLGDLIITSHINQVDVAKLNIGMPFEFRVDSLGAIKMNGRVRTIAPMATIVNSIKGYVVTFKIENPNPRLRPGMTAQVSIPTNKVEEVTALPIGAIFENRTGDKIVYLPNGDNPPAEKVVEIGLTNNAFAQIKAGVDAGEKVLLTKPAPKS